MSDGSTLTSRADYPITAGLTAPPKVARWRVIGNAILAIPHVVILYFLQIIESVVIFVSWFVIVFTGRMPDGMGGFIAGCFRYRWRVTTYLLFLREPYPPFSVPTGYTDPGGDPAWVHIAAPQQYNRLAVLFRIIIAIPQFIFGFFVIIGFELAMIVAFFTVLITGGWPEGLRKFVVDAQFYAVRLNGWYSLLADPYPPFAIG
jgi:hypothetical protein